MKKYSLIFCNVKSYLILNNDFLRFYEIVIIQGGEERFIDILVDKIMGVFLICILIVRKNRVLFCLINFVKDYVVDYENIIKLLIGCLGFF